MEPDHDDRLPGEWVEAFRTTSAGVPEAQPVLEKAARDETRSRFDRMIVVGGLCIGGSVVGLALAFGRATGALSGLLIALLMIHLAVLGYVLSLGARPRVVKSASVAEHVAGASQRSLFRYRSVWAVILMHFSAIALSAALLLPYVVRRFGGMSEAFFLVLAALVPVFAIGTCVLLRLLRSARVDLAEWRAIARSLAE